MDVILLLHQKLTKCLNFKLISGQHFLLTLSEATVSQYMKT